MNSRKLMIAWAMCASPLAHNRLTKVFIIICVLVCLFLLMDNNLFVFCRAGPRFDVSKRLFNKLFNRNIWLKNVCEEMKLCVKCRAYYVIYQKIVEQARKQESNHIWFLDTMCAFSHELSRWRAIKLICICI